jgi:hypothetical protein
VSCTVAGVDSWRLEHRPSVIRTEPGAWHHELLAAAVVAAATACASLLIAVERLRAGAVCIRTVAWFGTRPS